MTAATLLDRLESVRETGRDKWIARCPAHDDRGPSLSIKDVGEKLVIHCFAGCAAVDVMNAVGLELHDLLDEKCCAKCSREFHPLHPEHDLCSSCFKGDPSGYHRQMPRRSKLPARDALEAIDHEAHVVAVIGADVLEHKDIDNETWGRLALAVSRIGNARIAT